MLDQTVISLETSKFFWEVYIVPESYNLRIGNDFKDKPAYELFDTFCSGKPAIKREMTGETEWAVDLCSGSGNQYVR